MRGFLKKEGKEKIPFPRGLPKQESEGLVVSCSQCTGRLVGTNSPAGLGRGGRVTGSRADGGAHPRAPGLAKRGISRMLYASAPQEPA